MHGLTQALGDWIAHMPGPPEPALDIATRGLIDAFGCMVAGSREPVIGHLSAELLEGSRSGGLMATVLLGPHRARVDEAALINATAAHALAMDDVAAGCHPSAILMPTVLALAGAVKASGRDVLQAYVAGFEVLTALAGRLPGGPHRSGWHPSGVLGPVAAAAAAARLMRLPAAACTGALGIAASMGGGVGANFGTQTKALHVGRAAAAGVMAARLAQRGVTAAADALERATGLLALVGGEQQPGERDFVLAAVDGPWSILTLGLSIKRYPVCYSLHRVVDAAAGLGERARALPGIAGIDVHIGAAQAAMARHTRPRTGLEARYSVEFAVACGLLAGDAGYAQLTSNFLDSPALQGMLPRIRRRERDDRSGEDGVFAASDRVVVHGADGTLLDSGEVRWAIGHARRPIDDESLRRKFQSSFERGGRGDGPTVFGALMSLRAQPQVTALLDAITATDD